MSFKPIFLILIAVLGAKSAGCQTTPAEAENIATFTKVWGFLKYYHPVVAKGKFDWDKEFMVRVNAASHHGSKQEISKFYLDWINTLGLVPPCRKCKNDVPDSLKFNLDLNWTADSTKFTPEVISKLRYIQQNRNHGKQYYVQQNLFVGNTAYKNEKPYKDSVFPSEPLRLLALARYWNIINYFYPYKYRTDENWNKVLVEMIPVFKDCKDTMDYHLAMLQLTTKITDSHAFFVTPYTNRYFGLKWAPFQFKIIDSKVIVTGFYDDSLCRLNDVRHGDVFLKVDGKTLADIIKEKSKYIGASNEPTRLRNLFYGIFNGSTDSVLVTYERDGKIAEKYVHRDLIKNFHRPRPRSGGSSDSVYKIIDGNIGYVDMGALMPKQVAGVMKKLKDTKAIIFDVRNYPNGTMFKISDFLNDKSKQFVKFTSPDMSYPGVFRYDPAYACGRKNKDYYRGKVVLLSNELSQSHAEFTLMALRTAPNVTIIGSQTAGADGNISPITFPGNYRTFMTGIGVYYPNGKETQRIGIVPDIEVKPTIEGIKANRDEVLEKALEVIRASK